MSTIQNHAAVSSPYAPVAPGPAPAPSAPAAPSAPPAPPAESVTLSGGPNAAAVEAEAPAGSDPVRAAGTAMLVALSLAGAAGSVAHAAPPPATAQSLPATADAGRAHTPHTLPYDPTHFKGGAPHGAPQAGAEQGVEATTPTAALPTEAEDRVILDALDAKGLLRTPRSETDGDDYGRKMSASDAMARLQRGEAVVVKAPIGSPSYFTQPFPVYQSDVDFHTTYEGVRITSPRELERLNAIEGLTATDTSSVLEAGDKEAIALLKGLEGGVAEGFVRDRFEWPTPGPVIPGGPMPGPQMPQHTWEYLPRDPVPATYSQEWKRGFLGLGKHQDRITAYEALNELKAGRELTVRDAKGVMVQVHNLDELRAVAQPQPKAAETAE